MIRIRPHHILCLKFYKGEGYSKEFVDNMTFIYDSLNKDNKKVILVDSSDDICKSCPNLNNGICTSEDNILDLDRKTLDNLGFKVGKEYKYSEIVELRDKLLTRDLHSLICGNCKWYKDKVCRLEEENI